MNYFPRYGEGDEQGTIIGFSSLGNDVTELKRIDRMKSEFVSTVSHELRTPLTSIRGSLGLVWGGVTGELPAQAKNLVGIAKTNCERLIRLINDILDSEKIESGKMTFELQAHGTGAPAGAGPGRQRGLCGAARREAGDAQCQGAGPGLRRQRPADPGGDQPAVQCHQVLAAGRRRAGGAAHAGGTRPGGNHRQRPGHSR
jgi:hypothetical protein